MDSLKLADQLETENVFPAEQARAFSRIMAAMADETHASKADLDMSVLRMDSKIDAAVLRLEVKISESQKELIKWFAGIMIVQGLTVMGGTAALVHMLK
jgi:hypothetical protein